MSPAKRSPASWVMVSALIALNVWYDYHHPLGIMFDVVLGVGLLIWYPSQGPTFTSLDTYPRGILLSKIRNRSAAVSLGSSYAANFVPFS